MKFLLSLFSFLFIAVKRNKKPGRELPDPEREQERAELFPPPYPNGWYHLCPSADVKAGEVKEVEVLGQRFAVFRGEDGKVGVMDIYCPHLNANLADGCVKGNHLVCPFHNWEFRTDGKCAHIPYAEGGVPEHAKANSWTAVENWGMILIWYHADGEPPSWTTEEYLPEVRDYKYHGITSDILHIHLQDFAENGADYAHFKYVHNLLTIPFSERFIELTHTVEINFGGEDEKHLAWFTNQTNLHWKKSGKVIEEARGDTVVTYYGPGFLVFRFDSRIAKDVILIKSFTPIAPLKLRMDDLIYAPKGTSRLAIWYIMREARAQFHDDIVIWEKKGYTERPMLVKGDGPIMKMRKWYSQFYN